mgnify:CR=1 FL=1
MFDPAVSYLRAYLTERDVLVWGVEATEHETYIVRSVTGRVEVPCPEEGSDVTQWASATAEWIAQRIGRQARRSPDGPR